MTDLFEKAIPIATKYVKSLGLTKADVDEYAAESGQTPERAIYDMVSNSDEFGDVFDDSYDVMGDAGNEIVDSIEYTDSELFDDLAALGSVSQKEINMFLEFLEGQGVNFDDSTMNEIEMVRNGNDVISLIEVSHPDVLKLIKQFWIDSLFLDTWGYGESEYANPELWAAVYRNL